jgi:hypothetical protein
MLKNLTTYAEYGTNIDFRKIFGADIERLYLLAFLLTTNHDDAEECVVTGLEDASEGNPALKEWDTSSNRRLIIQSAMRRVFSSSAQIDQKRDLWNLPSKHSQVGETIDAITNLGQTERFVYVSTVLERYSDEQCSALLNCTKEDVAQARVRAFQRLRPAT